MPRLKQVLGGWLRSGPRIPPASAEPHVLEHYVQGPPSPQHAVDLFAGMWSSKFPEGTPAVSGAEALAFEDGRLVRGIEGLGGLNGKTVLELGPLDGGHSYMLERAGAASVVSIEANTRAYLRCLITKEIFALQRVRFLLGDFLAYLRTTNDRFDVCIASGVLYHMSNPPELIALIANHAQAMYCWTHYYDEQLMRAAPVGSLRIVAPTRQSHAGFEYDAFTHVYGAVRHVPQFCGSAAPSSVWMRREDIERCCRFFGLTRFEPVFDEPHHIHGPSWAFVASR